VARTDPCLGTSGPAARRFPSRIVQGGDQVTIAGAVFTVTDLGPSESPYDSLWRLESDGAPRAFVGDLVYSHMHAYLADGFYERWLVNLDRATRELPADVMLLMGHGQPVAGHAILNWQASYIHRFLDALQYQVVHDGLQGDALADAVTAQMKEFLPTDDLLFLMRLSIEPIRLRLGLRAGEKYVAASERDHDGRSPAERFLLTAGGVHALARYS
jgi:hypothetical protein